MVSWACFLETERVLGDAGLSVLKPSCPGKTRIPQLLTCPLFGTTKERRNGGPGEGIPWPHPQLETQDNRKERNSEAFADL